MWRALDGSPRHAHASERHLVGEPRSLLASRVQPWTSPQEPQSQGGLCPSALPAHHFHDITWSLLYILQCQQSCSAAMNQSQKSRACAKDTGHTGLAPGAKDDSPGQGRRKWLECQSSQHQERPAGNLEALRPRKWGYGRGGTAQRTLRVLAVAKLALPWQARLLMVFYSPLLWPVHGSWKHAAPSIKSSFFFLADESQSSVWYLQLNLPEAESTHPA